jgi:rare lipoprotein A
MYRLTAAHPTLPMDTRVLVTNLKNGRTVEVRINDRGPHVKGRIIDLSFAAARQLGATSGGTIPVRIVVLSTPPQ